MAIADGQNASNEVRRGISYLFSTFLVQYVPSIGYRHKTSCRYLRSLVNWFGKIHFGAKTFYTGFKGTVKFLVLYTTLILGFQKYPSGIFIFLSFFIYVCWGGGEGCKS